MQDPSKSPLTNVFGPFGAGTAVDLGGGMTNLTGTGSRDGIYREVVPGVWSGPGGSVNTVYGSGPMRTVTGPDGTHTIVDGPFGTKTVI